MNKKYTWVMALVVLVAVSIAGFLFFGTNSKTQKAENQNTKTAQNTNGTAPAPLYQQTIAVTASGFKPQTLTVKPGTRIIWLNTSGATTTVNSDNYPTNLLFPFLNLGRFGNNQSVSTLFTSVGKFTYHNELNADQRGTIIVQ